MDKDKLIILSAFYEPYMSGAEQMVKEVAERLGGRYETYLITGLYDRKLARVEKRANFTLLRVGIGHKQIDKILYIFLAALKVRQIKPRIVHAIMESYAGAALVLVKYLYASAKRILTLQSGDLDHEQNQQRFLFRLFWRMIHTSPTVVTAISTFLAKRAENLGVKQVLITPNGLDFSEVPVQSEKIAKRVICVARLSWEKGLDDLLRAWSEVVRNIPEAKIVFVGDGLKRGEMEQMVRDLNIENSVEFKGNVPHSQVLVEIKKSEIFVCPSLAEGLGNVFIEAQACGVPPIGTRVGGIPDVIADGENGLLIEPKNSSQISAAINKLLNDKELLNKMSVRGLETCKKFNWERIVEEIDRIYKL